MRYGLSGGIALGFGIAWGRHLSDVRHEPRLLWVSVALAVSTAALAWRRRRVTRPTAHERRLMGWRYLVAPPWRWPSQRLLGFTAINLALAIGILLGHQPSA